MNKSAERVEAGELAKIALCVGRVAQEKGVEAVYEPHPLQRFRLTLTKRAARHALCPDAIYETKRYLDPLYLANYRGDLAEYINRRIEAMQASLDKHAA